MRRLAKLERERPAQQPDEPLALDLAPDLEARIAAAMQAGTFPQMLCNADLAAIVDAADVARGKL